jgi:hypothetical protein
VPSSSEKSIRTLYLFGVIGVANRANRCPLHDSSFALANAASRQGRSRYWGALRNPGRCPKLSRVVSANSGKIVNLTLRDFP